MNKYTFAFLKWFTETGFYRGFARKYLANLTFRFWRYPKFKVSNYWEIKKIIQEKKGEGLFVFLGADREALSFKFEKWALNSKYGHAGFITVREDGELNALDVTHEGLRAIPLVDYLAKIDDFALGFLAMTVDGVTEAKRRIQVLTNSTDQIEYDYCLKMEPELMAFVEKGIIPDPKFLPFKIYCSEFVYLACKGLVLNSDFKTIWIEDREFFEPDSLYEDAQILFEERCD